MFNSAAVEVTPSWIFSSATVDVSAVVPSLRVAYVSVPVKVGPAIFALVATAVAILSNSVSNSAPLIIFPLSPEGKLSLASKSVVFV